ncbi:MULTISPECIES: helix-turn-helix transcriptional regulator [Pantoea]|uniref:helix-turn-helix transcriptional regulator n=1 Tax=Pantoea TaxID=53335 RepID=UPI0030B9A498
MADNFMTLKTYPTTGHARPRATAEFLQISTVTLWRWQKHNPAFPKSKRISPRVSVYDAQEIRQWVKDQSSGVRENW